MFKSLFSSTLWKILASFCAFISVPILLEILGVENYASWVALTSMFGWLTLFDFGAGYSLRNRVAEYYERKDFDKLNNAVDGTFSFFCISALILIVCFGIAMTQVSVFKEYPVHSIILYIPLILSFPSLIGSFIYQGLGKIPEQNLLSLVNAFVWLVILLLYKYFCLTDFLYVTIAYSLVYLFFRLYVYFRSIKYAQIKNVWLFSISRIRGSLDVMKSGLKFLALQLSSLVLFSCGNIVIYSNLTAYETSQYDMTNKVYLLTMTLYNNIIAVFWTEISKAKAMGDSRMLDKIRNKLYYITIFVDILFCIGSIFFPWFIKFWTKSMIEVTLYDMLPFAILFVIQTLSYAGAVFLNAFENLKWQIRLSILGTILFFPLVILLFRCGVGYVGVPLTTTMILLPTLIYTIYASRKCIKLN